MNEKMLDVKDLITAVDKEIVFLHYCEGHIRHHRECWNVLRKYMENRNECFLTADIAQQYLQERYGIELYSAQKVSCYKALMRRSVLMLLEYQVSGMIYKRMPAKAHDFPFAFETPCNMFLNQLRENGLADGTIRGYRSTIERFVEYLNHHEISDISQVNVPIIYEYLNCLCGCSKSYANRTVRQLRFLFSYLHEEGIYPCDIQGIWPNVRVEQYCNLPETISPDEAKRLLDAVDRGNALGKRNYAILLIAIRYGLRVSDIRALEFCNVDFRNQKLRLTQRKTGKSLEFELFDDVGWALIDYIKNGRPVLSTDSRIFVLHKAPYNGFSDNDNLSQIICRYGREAGLTTAHKRFSMHILRYTLASTLLSNNTPLPIVSSILGHTQLDTTKIYTKIDYQQLKMCALEVPYAE